MDTPLLITMLSCFTCCLFIFRVVGGVPDVGTTAVDKEMHPHLCLDAERSALLEFKQSFSSTSDYASESFYKMNSWKAGGDCCFGWDGVECDQVTGHVIALDLSSNGIYGFLSGNSTLFQLFHLQMLNLSNNDLQGPIPSSIFHFSNLSSLDLSLNALELHRPSFKDLVGNFTKLEHLHLDHVDMAGSTLPGTSSNYSRLKSLHLSSCSLSGEIPSGIFRSPKLRILDLSFNPSLNGHFPEFDGSSSLEELSIGSCNFSSLTPPGRLANLTYLDLSYNPFLGFNSSSFSWLSNLTKLTYLDLSFNSVLGLKSSSFFWLSNLTKLTHLNLREMKISGEIPPQITYLTALNYLDISYNDLSGQMTQAWFSNLTQLVTLRLSSNQLTGQIPSSLSTLTNLVVLDLSSNQLTGQIPSSLSTLTELETFDLSSNQLTGQIPSSISTLTKLVALSLDNNQLTGSIPSLINLTHLQDINLSYNRLEVEISNCFLHMSGLVSLNLYSNNLNGKVELDTFHKLRDLSILKLSQNNLTLLVNEGVNSVLPEKYGVLGLGSCHLSRFPRFLLNQSQLEWLDLSQNNIHGMVPTWIWNLSLSIDSLNISHNFLTTIEAHSIVLPFSIIHYSDVIFDISFNMLQGSLPVPSLSTNFFLASNNNFSGQLSPLFCNLSNLTVLDASNNNISGTIPQCLGTFSTSLWTLDLHNNMFHGTIPQSWNNGSSLKMIDLSQNQLQGKVPKSLCNCSEIEFIDFGNNKIHDTFPSWLGALGKLKVLMLHSNRFYGEIQNPEGKSEFVQLRIVDLSFNAFSGKLPSMFFQSWRFMESLDADKRIEYMEIELVAKMYNGDSELGHYEYSIQINNKGMERLYSKIPNIFRALDFSYNQFEGEIPTSIAKLKGLQLLNLGRNNFTGTIPTWLGDLHQLESLDLSHNKLSGKIPQELSQLTFLSFFSVSYNNLSGIIPHGGQWDTFENSSYEGNPGLVAYHPTQPPTLTPKSGGEEEDDDDDDDDDNEPVFDKIEWMVILMGCGSGFVVGIVLGNELVVRKPLWFLKLLGRWL